jgi:hypothetical protein
MTGQFWQRPQYPNQVAALAGYVGTGAPLVAAFELGAIALILTQPQSPQLMPLAGAGIAAMCASVACMIFSILYGFWAVSYWNGPGDRLAWNPAAAADLGQLHRERENLAHHQHLFRLTGAIAERLFQVGLLFFLLALLLLLVPPPARPGKQSSTVTPTLVNGVGVSGWRVVGAWVIGLALALEVLWVVLAVLRGRLAELRWWLAYGIKPTESKSRQRILRCLAVLEKIVWHLGKPFSPNRWRAPYVPIDRPQTADMRAVFGNAEGLATDLAIAVQQEPAEWPVDRARWTTPDSVNFGGKPLGGQMWADWPWALASDNADLIVIHPLGVIEGRPDRVRRRLEVLEQYFNGKSRRDKRSRRALRHLDHLVAGKPADDCPICSIPAQDWLDVQISTEPVWTSFGDGCYLVTLTVEITNTTTREIDARKLWLCGGLGDRQTVSESVRNALDRARKNLMLAAGSNWLTLGKIGPTTRVTGLRVEEFIVDDDAQQPLCTVVVMDADSRTYVAPVPWREHPSGALGGDWAGGLDSDAVPT